MTSFKPHKTTISKLFPCDKNQNGSLVARVIRLWWRTDDKKPEDCRALEFILLDAEGSTIHATIDGFWLRIFKEKVTEGEAYVISKYIVGPNTYKIKVTTNKLRIFFHSTTKITKLKDCRIPRNRYNIVDFNDIVHHNVEENTFFDVVAEVVNYNAICKSKDKGSDYTTINMRDTNGDDIVCVIYGNYTRIITAICSGYNNQDRLPVVAIQYVKRGTWDNKDCIVTNRGATRFVLNPGIHQAAALYSRIDADQAAGRKAKITYRATQCNDLFWKPNLKTVAEINNTDKAGNFITVVTFSDIPHKPSWFFNSCNHCMGNCVRGYSGEWFCKNPRCSKCETPQQSVTPRFMVIFGVHDHKGDRAEIKLFDNHIKHIVKEKACELIIDPTQPPTLEALPPQLLAFLEKTAVVRVNVSREHNLDTRSKIYSVQSISFEKQDIVRWFQMYEEIQGKGKNIVEDADGSDGTKKATPELTEDQQKWKDLEEVVMTLNVSDPNVIDHTVLRNPRPNEVLSPYLHKVPDQTQSTDAAELEQVLAGVIEEIKGCPKPNTDSKKSSGHPIEESVKSSDPPDSHRGVFTSPKSSFPAMNKHPKMSDKKEGSRVDTVSRSSNSIGSALTSNTSPITPHDGLKTTGSVQRKTDQATSKTDVDQGLARNGNPVDTGAPVVSHLILPTFAHNPNSPEAVKSKHPKETHTFIVQGLQSENAHRSLRGPSVPDSSNAKKPKVKHVAVRRGGVNARNAAARTTAVLTQPPDSNVPYQTMQSHTKSTNTGSTSVLLSTEATEPQVSQCFSQGAPIARKLFCGDTPVAARVIDPPALTLNDPLKIYTLKRKAQDKYAGAADEVDNIGVTNAGTHIGGSMNRSSISKIKIGSDGRPDCLDEHIQRIVKIKQEKISPPKGK